MEYRERRQRLYLMVVTALTVVGPGLVQGQGLDVKAWLGNEPLTPRRIVDDLVDYFSTHDPVGIPVLDVPKTIHIPGEVAASAITFRDASFRGHSALRLEDLVVNLTSLSAKARLSLPLINFEGDYTWVGWTNSEGYANITMLGMYASLDLFFGVSELGHLNVNAKIDLVYDDLRLNFTGLAFTHRVAVSAAGTFFSTFIQPLLFSKVQGRIQTVINGQLENRTKNFTFPDSLSPVDFAVAKLRMDLRDKGMDPLRLEDQERHLTWGVTVQLQNIQISGLTTVHRTHEISAHLIDGAVYLIVQLGTQTLLGGADWSISASLFPAVGGRLTFYIEQVEVKIEVKQPANIRSPPTLRDIDIKLGNIAIKSEGEGTFDFLLEALINILPNCFRNQIMDRVEPIIRQRIQKEFNRLDVYKIVMDKLQARENNDGSSDM